MRAQVGQDSLGDSVSKLSDTESRISTLELSIHNLDAFSKRLSQI